MTEEKVPKEKTYTVKYSKSELVNEIAALESDEELNLFWKFQNGAVKFAKYNELVELLNKTEPEEPGELPLPKN